MTADQDLAAGMGDRLRLSVAQILDMCDAQLGEVGRRMQVFGWLRPPGAGATDWIPVDSYYPAKHIVVVCRDQPYENDRLFRELVPQHGLWLLELEPAKLGAGPDQVAGSLARLIAALRPGTPPAREAEPDQGAPAREMAALIAAAGGRPVPVAPRAQRAPATPVAPLAKPAQVARPTPTAPIAMPAQFAPATPSAPAAPRAPFALLAPFALPAPNAAPARRVGQSEAAAAKRGARFVATHETRTFRPRDHVPRRVAPPPPQPAPPPAPEIQPALLAGIVALLVTLLILVVLVIALSG